MNTGTGSIQGCDATDDKCLCDDTTYVSGITSCFEDTCKGADLANAMAYSELVCQVAVRPILFLFL
jgi:hypothetical protein